MSAQLHELVFNSIKMLLKYFERYLDDTASNLQLDIVNSKVCDDENTYTKLAVTACRPAFLVELCVNFERKIMCFHGNGNAYLEDLVQQISNFSCFWNRSESIIRSSIFLFNF